jgi:hypothetical protein
MKKLAVRGSPALATMRNTAQDEVRASAVGIELKTSALQRFLQL